MAHKFSPSAYNMSAQGVPGMIREIRELRERHEKDTADFRKRIDRLEILLKDEIRTLPQRVMEEVVKQINVDGAKELTMEQINIDGAKELTKEDVQTNIISGLPSDQSSVAAAAVAQHSASAVNDDGSHLLGNGDDNKYTSFAWESWRGNELINVHMVPEGFIFPSYNCRTMWLLWWFGNSIKYQQRDVRIAPYRLMRPKNDLVTHACKVNFSRCQRIMRRLVDLIRIDHPEIASEGMITKENHQLLFESAFPKLIAELYEKPKARQDEIIISTLANRKRMFPQQND